MSTQHDDSNSIDEFFDRIKDILLQTWHETGFGHLEVDSERVKHNKIGVTVRGSTHYRYIITDEDIQRWRSRGSL